MTSTMLGLACLGCTVALAACNRGAADHPHPTPPPLPSATAATAPPAAALDPRAPVPLTEAMALHQKAEMRDHLRVVREIAGALARDDFAAVTTAAGRISWSEEQAAMCKHLGAGAPGFSAMGERFHRTATTIVEAAQRRDRAGVLVALDATIATCVGCHDTFRQDIVSDEAFGALGGGAACPMHGKPAAAPGHAIAAPG